MYKYGKWNINEDGTICISLEGIEFPLDDMSKETQEQINQEIKNGKTDGDIVEINEPLDADEISEFRHRTVEIQAILENDLYEKEDEFILVSERNQIDNILEETDK